MRKVLLALCLFAIPALPADIYNFNSLPADGNIAGSPGETIGWGYSLQNQSSALWLVTTELNSSGFLNSTPKLIFDFPAVAPGASVTLPYDPSSGAGLYEMTWAASAPLGFVNSGTFDLSAQWWSGDPLPGGSLVSSALDAFQSYSATVTPEPSSIGLAGFALLSLLGLIAARKSGEDRNSVLR